MNPTSFRDRLRARATAAHVDLSDDAVDRLETYHQLLTRWNRRINLTALPLDPLSDEGVDRLFVEPLAAAQLVDNSALRWIDVGSGGGSPAIPLRIARPLAKLTMVEVRSRKAAFLREVARALEFRDVVVISERVEAVARDSAQIHSVDLITVRAVRLDASAARTYHELLAPGGQAMVFHSANAVCREMEGFRVGSMTRLLDSDSSRVTMFVAV